MATTSTTILVGIDVGMTCTGVSYAIKSEDTQMVDPYVIQNWPGGGGGQSDKVPTTLFYHRSGRVSWGFMTKHENDQEGELREWFKIFFDEAEYDRAQKKRQSIPYLPPSHSHVRRYYEDFLRQLYPHIKSHLEDNVRQWSTASIEFLFSVPTTWTKLGLTQEFKRLATNAGFGRDGPNHVVEVSLTEAEAAAVHTFNSQSALYSNEDVMMIVDAGGGTTDVGLLKVEKKEGNRPALKSLDEVRGDEIGSVEIDLDFADLVEKRLLPVAQQLGMTHGKIQAIINEMTRKDFKLCKEEFGTPMSKSQHQKRIEIPRISDSVSIPSANIVRGALVFQNSEIQGLFDRQLRAMYRLIDYQLQNMSKVAPNDRVSHLVLSGGLGSSQYVKDKLIQRYTVDNIHAYAPELRVVTSSRPQLAVVKGLVQDRMQRIKLNVPVLKSRVCRQSIGIVCMQEYNRNRAAHQQAELHRDDVDNILYAKDQVVWLVEQGQQIEQDFIDHAFYRTFRKYERKPWESQIAICNSRLKPLPMIMRKGNGIQPLCKMTSNLTSVPLTGFEKKKKHWWQFWKKVQTHYKATFTIRFLLKHASVESELLFKGQKYNEANSFQVTWETGANVAAPREHRQSSPDKHM